MTAPLLVRAVIVAAGRGSRFGGDLPKQFSKIGGRTVLVHSLYAVASLPGIAEIIVVVPDGGLPSDAADDLAEAKSAHQHVHVQTVPGGERRQDSVLAGLGALSAPCDVALVHDAARPFPPMKPMRELIESAHSIGGGLLAVRAADTIKRADDEGNVASTLDRDGLWLAQTPQAFRGQFIHAMFPLLRSATEFTDEAAVLEALGIGVKLIESTPANIKITRAEDLQLAETLLEKIGL